MASESSEDIWSLVLVGGKYFLGRSSEGEILVFPGSVAEFDKVFEITTMLLPTPGPDGRPVFHKEISCDPFLLSFEGSKTRMKPDIVVLFSEMKPRDRARYKALVDRAEQIAGQARAASVGLVVPES